MALVWDGTRFPEQLLPDVPEDDPLFFIVFMLSHISTVDWRRVSKMNHGELRAGVGKDEPFGQE